MKKNLVRSQSNSIAKFAGVALMMAVTLPLANAQETDWSGLYIGSSLGIDGQQINSTWGEVRITDVVYGTGGKAFVAPGRNGVAMIGLHAGYLQQWGDWVAGVEVGWSGAELRFGDHEIAPVRNAGMRAGYAWKEMLFSVSSGYAITDMYLNYPASNYHSDGLQHGGWYLGLHGECMVTPSLSLGLEYVHHDFAAERVVTIFTRAEEFDLNIESIRIRATFHL